MKSKMLKRIANNLLLLGIVVTLLGAIYIAMSFQNYSISGCFVVADILMFFLWRSSKIKNNGIKP